MATPQVHFVLEAFAQDISLNASALIPRAQIDISANATITLTNAISAVALQNVFFYRTDEDITSNGGGVTDSSFVYYYTDVTKWPATPTIHDTLNPTHGTVTSNFYVAADPVAKDFIRDLAKQLFGTYLGADLFTNEDVVVTDIRGLTTQIGVDLENKIKSVDISGGRFNSMCSLDGSGNYFVKDQIDTSNLVREMFIQLMYHAPGRFMNIGPHAYDTRPGFYKMPFVEGDTFSFKLTLHPAPEQRGLVSTGTTPLVERTYIVKLNVSA